VVWFRDFVLTGHSEHRNGVSFWIEQKSRPQNPKMLATICNLNATNAYKSTIATSFRLQARQSGFEEEIFTHKASIKCCEQNAFGPSSIEHVFVPKVVLEAVGNSGF
jgi:hypothetical protein